jgi:cytochrome P450
MADDAALHPTLSRPAAKPAHIPDSLVYDFDLLADPALLSTGHERILEIARNAPPVFWTPRRGGHWVLAGHEAAFEGSRNWEIFTSEIRPYDEVKAMLSLLPEGSPHVPLALPIGIDPPMHGVYRLPLNAAFSPKAMNTLKDSIRELARSLIAKVAPDGRCEFMSAIAEPLPVQIFLKLMGLPLERQAEYRSLVKETLQAHVEDPGEGMRTMLKIAASMRPTFEERRQNPTGDLISLLWRTEIEGKPATMDDMENWGVLLFIAGLDTVMNGMGHAARHLAVDQALQDRLRADPALIGEASEEMLRRYTFTVPPRRVAKDAVFHGVEMKAGERVDLFLPAADLDPQHFEHPEVYDIDRDAVHVAFGAGPHRCLGSHLARIELIIFYEEMLAGLPSFRLDPERPPTYHGGPVIGPETLHLVWDVAP